MLTLNKEQISSLGVHEEKKFIAFLQSEVKGRYASQIDNGQIEPDSIPEIIHEARTYRFFYEDEIEHIPMIRK